jgi:dienelactone hydrolase
MSGAGVEKQRGRPGRSPLRARLITTEMPSRAEGAVIVLHGGASSWGRVRVSPAQLSVLRMVPIAKRVARDGEDRLAVFRLLNSHRGWDADQTPVRDVLWALEEIEARLGEQVPVCLIGHSLGGRAALLASGAPSVRGAVALAPWVLPTDVAADVAGQKLLIVHGDRDHVADPRRSAALAASLGNAGADVAYVTVEGAGHAMLRRHGTFDGLASRFAAARLLGERHASGTLVDEPGSPR